MSGTFGTIADAIAAPTTQLSTGLPQLDRVAPLRPGQLIVFIGPSAVGKTRVAEHMASTVRCTNDRGVLTVNETTTLEALESSIAFAHPALVIVDPLTALLTDEARATVGAGTSRRAKTRDMWEDGSDDEPPDVDPAYADAEEVDQYPVQPAVLGELAENLRELAGRHEVPVLICHRHAPIRDSTTDRIVSTESINPLLDVADLAIVVRVLADPRTTGLEIIHNSSGPELMLRVPFEQDARRRCCAGR